MTNPLFEPYDLGDIRLSNRIVMAPLTRSRAANGLVPGPHAPEYYSQRASAGLIITEATQISAQAQGYQDTPGLYTPAQIAGWRSVTDAVHEAGGKIFVQLWHVGRVSHVDLQPDHAAPVAPSAIAAETKTFVNNSFVPVSEPRALELDEIPGIITDFRNAAADAIAAGFDGVEIHGANGYLLQQFLRRSTNQRSDEYGGSLENRARFCLEVAHAVLEVWEPGRVGYRVSPMAEGDEDPQDRPIDTYAYLSTELGKLGLAYIHVVEAFRDSARDHESEQVFGAVRRAFRDAGGLAYIGNGEYVAESAARRINDDKADAIAFGKPFISNPDLAERFRQDAPLNEWHQSTFYGGGPEGYTDYPTLDG